MAVFLTGFAAALAPHGLEVSQDVGQAAFPANTDTSKVKGSKLRLFGMDTYTCNETGPRAFTGFVMRGVAHLGTANYGAALSSVNSSVLEPGTSASECIGGFRYLPPPVLLHSRFRLLASQGVEAIALLQGSPDPQNMTGQYMPLMKEWIAGSMFSNE